VSFRSDSPMLCTVSGSAVTTIAVGTCSITAFQGGSATYAGDQALRSFQVTVTTHRLVQQILFGPVPGATVGVPVVLTASSRTAVFEGRIRRQVWPCRIARQPGRCARSQVPLSSLGQEAGG
jgi:hypothetical protein